MGLDNAGKTTLLYLLKTNKFIQSMPTHQVTSEELQIGNLILTTYDIGGHKQIRRVWADYFPVTNAIVFVIDSCDRFRFVEARAELDALLNMELLSNTPILILANKIDKYGAAGEDEIKLYFNLESKLTGKTNFKPNSRPIELFMCSLKAREGYGEAFKWLSKFF